MTMTEEEKIKEEIAFTDYWFTELGKTTTPTFADAIEWAEKRQRKIDVEKGKEFCKQWYNEIIITYMPELKDEPFYSQGLQVVYDKYEKAMMED